MKFANLDGIETRYEITGEGEPLLMFSPGGFDATIEKWSTLGIYAKVKPVEHLQKRFKCILFDRRECGQSSGRIEPVSLADYARQGRTLLEFLNIEKAHLIGGCMGCGPVAAFAVAYPEVTLKMVLFWPVGGARYRLNGQARFAEHLGFVLRHGMQAVVDVVRETGKPFGGDPRGGPWASVIKNDAEFANAFSKFDLERYKFIIIRMQAGLLDRDSVPGIEAEALMLCGKQALIVPGNDSSHATSAARYLHECLANSVYWDAAVDEQTETATAEKLLTFLAG